MRFAPSDLEHAFFQANQQPGLYHARQPVADVLFAVAVVVVRYFGYFLFCGFAFGADKIVNGALLWCHFIPRMLQRSLPIIHEKANQLRVLYQCGF